MQAESLDLEFVDHPDVRAVLDDYYSQTRRAAESDSYLGVIVGCGAVVEGILTWALLGAELEASQSGKAGKDKAGNILPIERWPLTNLIDTASAIGLIGNTAKQASWALKDFRNFVHPYNLLQQSARPDAALAMSAMAALKEIARSLAGRRAS